MLDGGWGPSSLCTLGAQDLNELPSRNSKWRGGIPPQAPQQDARLHPQTTASGSGAGIPFTPGRSVPTTLPDLGHSWESVTTEGSSVVKMSTCTA